MAGRTRGGTQRIPRPARWRHGDAAPWATRAAQPVTLIEVRERLLFLPPPRAAQHGSSTTRAAAVLVAMFEADGEARVILTKRPDTMPSHRGEIAFPGGKHDPRLDADLRATALREAEEEIALMPASVEVIAQLDGLGTVASQFAITPFIGFLDGRPQLTPHPREVASVFDVGISELLDPATFHEERWGALSLHFYELASETIWGATARILTNLLTHITNAA